MNSSKSEQLKTCGYYDLYHEYIRFSKIFQEFIAGNFPMLFPFHPVNTFGRQSPGPSETRVFVVHGTSVSCFWTKKSLTDSKITSLLICCYTITLAFNRSLVQKYLYFLVFYLNKNWKCPYTTLQDHMLLKADFLKIYFRKVILCIHFIYIMFSTGF